MAEQHIKVCGVQENLFSNKSGRVSLITRMAARGVPNEVGCMISGHHTQGGYAKYDWTARLKQEAATLAGSRPDKEVTDKLNKEQGECSVTLKPFVDVDQMHKWEELQRGHANSIESSTCTILQLAETHVVEGSQESTRPGSRLVQANNELVRVNEYSQNLAKWHQDYDGDGILERPNFGPSSRRTEGDGEHSGRKHFFKHAELYNSSNLSTTERGRRGDQVAVEGPE